MRRIVIRRMSEEPAGEQAKGAGEESDMTDR
jgi:hypothetical protein